MKRFGLLGLVAAVVLLACAPGVTLTPDPGGASLTVVPGAVSTVELLAGSQELLPVEGQALRVFGVDLAVNPGARCVVVARHLECPVSRLSPREVYRLPVRGRVAAVSVWIARPDRRQYPLVYP